ncbi:MAG TPA: pyrroloquinoline quinone-dependent dehydrogenase [Cyclobacteriaceae bacterium]|nr:pyrroloquinoline quinone-dependent dehydrogenase [Cyclobacteriaceae bacterium]
MTFRNILSILLKIALVSGLSSCKPGDVDWPEYHGDASRSHYSPLSQITPENLSNLEVAWTYSSSGADSSLAGTQMQCNPVIINGVMYGVSATNQVFAINAENGVEIWKTNITDKDGTTSRGVTHFADDKNEFIFWGGGRWLYCINAKDGKLNSGFGTDGRIDLKAGVDRPGAGNYITSNTPNTIYKNLIITGTRVSEDESALLGDIRAYDVHTGKLAWTFQTIPGDEEFGRDTWEIENPRRQIGGANAWAGMAIDRKRGIVYAPTGSAAYDFYGGNRKGNNLFSNCLIALDANTGKRLWHFQFVHHDLWDRDPPTVPNLLTVTHEGKKIDAIAQITKLGYVFVFDRVTGEPLFPIEERAVRTDGLPDEAYSSTQPFPLKPKPFNRQAFNVEDINPSASGYEKIREQLQKARTGEPYIPVTGEMTIFFPGTDGGSQWGGAATDPQGIMYVPSKQIPCFTTLVKREPKALQPEMTSSGLYTNNCASCHRADRKGNADGSYPSLVGLSTRYTPKQIKDLMKSGRGMMPAFSHLSDDQLTAISRYVLEDVDDHISLEEVSSTIPYNHTGYNRWFDDDGYPVSRPPWGLLTAIDLNSGEHLWEVPLGEYQELTDKGLPPTGTDNYGGPLVTESGLVFIAATRDQKFRAFDKQTGKQLWEVKLPAAGFATPATYTVNNKQYIVIACGGGKLKQPSGDKYVAFALTE